MTSARRLATVGPSNRQRSTCRRSRACCGQISQRARPHFPTGIRRFGLPVSSRRTIDRASFPPVRLVISGWRVASPLGRGRRAAGSWPPLLRDKSSRDEPDSTSSSHATKRGSSTASPRRRLARISGKSRDWGLAVVVRVASRFPPELPRRALRHSRTRPCRFCPTESLDRPEDTTLNDSRYGAEPPAAGVGAGRRRRHTAREGIQGSSKKFTSKAKASHGRRERARSTS